MFEQLNKQREQLLNEADELIASGDVDAANAKMDEVNALDEKINNAVAAKKNADALRAAAPVTDITAMSANIKGTEEGGTLNLNPEDVSDMETESIIIGGVKMAVSAADKKYENAWAKLLMGKANAEEKNFAKVYNEAYTHSTENTGILIPNTVTRGILSKAGKKHPFWENIFKSNVKGTLTILKGDNSSSAAWYDEADETEDGKETFGSLTLSGCELSRSITVTWKLKEMAVEEFIPYITRKMADRMGDGLGYGVMKGRGKSSSNEWKPEPVGVITALEAESGTPHIVTVDKPTDGQVVENLITMNALVDDNYRDTAYYVNKKTLFTKIAKITDTSGKTIFITDIKNESAAVGMILGNEVFIDPDVPDDCILLGDAYNGYQANINKQMSIETEDHKKQRTTDYIGYAIVDGAPVDLDAFALLKLNYT
ncbi:MAG: phage major capsid protein [Huintestinicola sp.]